MSHSFQTPHDPEDLLTPAQVSTLTKLAKQTLVNMRHRRVGPPYLKLGEGRNAPVRYRRRDVDQWLSAKTVRTGGAA